MVNERPEMLAKSATLYFGPWYRQSPFFKSTLRAGCTAYDIYNHMYLPGYYDDPVVELKQGDEMGRFLLGSTVVMLFPRGPLGFNPAWQPGGAVRMGQAMADLAR